MIIILKQTIEARRHLMSA